MTPLPHENLLTVMGEVAAAFVGFSTDRSESSRRMLSDSDSAEALAMLIRETVRTYARKRALHGMLALTIAALLSCGCVIIDVPIYPDEWTRVHREGEGSCPDLTGTYAASGRESGLIKLFWFLPFWWSSNAQSIPRLDQDLGLSLEWGRPLAIEGATAIQFDQADPGRIWFTVLRGDGSQIEEFDDMGFTRSSSRLDDSAHVFECREGWIEFGYEYHSGELDRWAMLRITRLANGALLVRANHMEGSWGPVFVRASSWHRYDAMRDPPRAP